MKEKIKKIIYNLPIYLKNYIILESNPDLSDNTYSLYKMLLENNVNKKYKLFWFVYDKNMYKHIKIKNVYFINAFGQISLFDKIKKIYINFKAKYIIDCNKFIYKMNKNQKRLHLGHGMPYKLVPEYCNLTGETDYILSLSNFFNDNIAKLHLVDKSKIVTLGLPRNDDLFSRNKNIKNLFKIINYEKVVIWLPTYRQHKNKNAELSMNSLFTLGIPIIYNLENLKKLNSTLKELNILLVLKPHPAQDLSAIKAENLSNFIILSDLDLKQNNINLYEFLGQTDALITDYSSVYYDYLLLDKPIAITVDDFEDYKKTFNFVYDDIFKVIKGEYINNYDNLITFFKNISTNNDVAQKEREKSKKLLHNYYDGNSSKRVYEFLLNSMGL